MLGTGAPRETGVGALRTSGTGALRAPGVGVRRVPGVGAARKPGAGALRELGAGAPWAPGAGAPWAAGAGAPRAEVARSLGSRERRSLGSSNRSTGPGGGRPVCRLESLGSILWAFRLKLWVPHGKASMVDPTPYPVWIFDILFNLFVLMQSNKTSILSMFFLHDKEIADVGIEPQNPVMWLKGQWGNTNLRLACLIRIWQMFGTLSLVI